MHEQDVSSFRDLFNMITEHILGRWVMPSKVSIWLDTIFLHFFVPSTIISVWE